VPLHIGIAPLSRWDLSELAADRPADVPPVFGGFVAGVDMFDARLAGRCRLTVYKPVLKAPMVSALGGRCRLTIY